MISVFLTVLPVFIVMAIGYVTGRVKYIPLDIADNLNTYALKIAIPTVLFFGMYRLNLGEALLPEMLTSFYAGAFGCFAIAIYLARTIWKRRPGESVSVGFSATFSNTVLMGIPVAILAFGQGINNFIFGIIALHASAIYTVGMFTMEFSRRDGRPLIETFLDALKSVFSNSLMIGILLGLSANLLSLKLPGPVISALEMIRATGIPVALFGIGLSLNRYSIGKEMGETIMVSFLALVAHPSITFLLAYYGFGLTGFPLYAAVVLACMPPGMNIYIFATMYNRAVSLSASVLIFANILSVFTIPIWLLILRGIS